MFLGAPMVAVALRGVVGLSDLSGDIWWATLRSLQVAGLATGLAVSLSLALGAPIVALQGRGSVRAARLADLAGLLPIAASPFVIGVALIVVMRGVADPFAYALGLTALVNAAMALPFCLRIVIPALHQAVAEHGRLADSLGLTG